MNLYECRSYNKIVVFYGTKVYFKSNYPLKRVVNVEVVPGNVRVKNSFSDNDVAVLTLEDSVQPNNDIQYAVLNPNNFVGRYDVIAYGWGITQFNGDKSERLLKIRLTTLNNDKCYKMFFNWVDVPNTSIQDFKVLCTEGLIRGMVHGDSGGPSFKPWFLVVTR